MPARKWAPAVAAGRRPGVPDATRLRSALSARRGRNPVAFRTGGAG
jgi:hypothetical protein